MNYSLYILESEIKETYYVGSSDDPVRRTRYHNAESKGYTQRHRPWQLVYTHPFDTKTEAQKAERIVKNWKSKKMIRLLIDGKIDIYDLFVVGRAVGCYPESIRDAGSRKAIPSGEPSPGSSKQIEGLIRSC